MWKIPKILQTVLSVLHFSKYPENVSSYLWTVNKARGYHDMSVISPVRFMAVHTDSQHITYTNAETMILRNCLTSPNNIVRIPQYMYDASWLKFIEQSKETQFLVESNVYKLNFQQPRYKEKNELRKINTIVYPQVKRSRWPASFRFSAIFSFPCFCFRYLVDA